MNKFEEITENYDDIFDNIDEIIDSSDKKSRHYKKLIFTELFEEEKFDELLLEKLNSDAAICNEKGYKTSTMLKVLCNGIIEYLESEDSSGETEEGFKRLIFYINCLLTLNAYTNVELKNDVYRVATMSHIQKSIKNRKNDE